MRAMSGRIDRYVVRAIGFTLVALVLFYLTVVNVSVSTISPPRRRLKLAPPLKCAPPRPPERPWQEFEAAPPGNNASSSLPLSSPSAPAWEFVASRDANNYGLSREQCGAAFPKLFAEIDKSVAARKGKNISFEDVDSRQMGSGEVRAMVYDGQLYVLEYEDMKNTFTRASATLNALNRALAAVPEPQRLPNIEFIFSSHDDASGPEPMWVYSKRDKDTDLWLMPDFGYWSWPETKVGAYKDVRRRIATVDDGLGFREKREELLWRGNVNTAPKLRGKLFRATRDKHWASVREIHWSDKKDVERNFVPIEDHCRYMFLAHVEGRSYSGRGKYLQNCRSVVVAHELHWLEAHHAALVHEGPDANYVRVNRNFTDLEDKIEHLLANPAEAERIAENGVRMFRDRYLTPAAEACYWRELVRAYGAMSEFEPVLEMIDEKTKTRVLRGVPFESFMLNGKLAP